MFPLRTTHILLSVFFLLGPGLFAQGDASSAELRREREALQLKLAATTRALETTKKDRGASVRRAALLQEQVEQRTELAETLREEIRRGEVHLRRDSTVIVALDTDLSRMRDEFARHLRAVNRRRLQRDWWVFLLGAEDWNGMLRRAVYLRQYRAYRVRQADMIRRTREDLAQRHAALAEQRLARDSLLAAVIDEDAQLRSALVEERQTLAKLTGSERKLLAQAKAQRARDAALEKEIRRLIREVIARDEAEARKRERAAASRSSAGRAATRPPRPRRGASISRQRGYLDWPTDGTVVQKFGNHPHPKLPKLRIRSNGIDIDAGPNAAVAAVYAGNVMSVRSLPGAGYLVMLRHGKYYTVYSNLEHALVKAGDEVKAGDQIGLTAGAGTPLHFELWKGKAAQNPERWLR